MDCETAREAISALLDDEPVDVSPVALERHLRGCPSCRAWHEAAHTVTRRARISPARAAPAVDESLLAALAAAGSQPRPRRSVSGARLALVAVALVQLAVTVPMLILGSDGGAPVHVAHEMGSFDAALAVGFLVAAWRPALASGIGMLVGVAALLLATTAAIDLVEGRTTLGDEAPHLLAIAGWLLLRRVAAHPLTPQSSSGSGLIEVLRRREQPAVVNLVRGGRR